MKLSVVLATYNEENNIAKCLESVKDIADEIIVVDGSSADKTRQISKSFGASVYKTVNRTMFHANKQMAIDKAQSEWILQLDADEVVDKELKNNIKEIKKEKTSFDAFYIKRKNFFLGKWLTKGGQYPDKVIRLFKKGKAHFPQKSVHEQLMVDGKIGGLEGHLLHFTAPTFHRYITNSNRYTSLTAEELHHNNVSISLFNIIKYMIIKPLITFLLLYIKHKGFIDGFEGFIFALMSGLHWPIAYLKLWEIKFYNN